MIASLKSSDHLSSVGLSYRPSVSFSHVWFPLHKHWTNFNQIAHQTFFCKWILKKWISLFLKGRQYSKGILSVFKNLFQNHGAIFNQTQHKIPTGKGCSNLFVKWFPPASVLKMEWRRNQGGRLKPFFKTRYYQKCENALSTFKTLLQNHWAYFVQTRYKSSLKKKGLNC